jgi:hypothetical protein
MEINSFHGCLLVTFDFPYLRTQRREADMSDPTRSQSDALEAPVRRLEQIPEAELAKEIPADDPLADLHGDPEAPPETRPEGPAPTAWRVAMCLLKLREQVNAMAPSRSKASDGTIGDAIHRSRSSDHNPWVSDAGVGVVSAMDITHDTVNGCDAGAVAEAIRASKDNRVKYMIWNRRIMSSYAVNGRPAWTWRAYTGKNGHTKHVHVSANSSKASYDSTAGWKLPGSPSVA